MTAKTNRNVDDNDDIDDDETSETDDRWTSMAMRSPTFIFCESGAEAGPFGQLGPALRPASLTLKGVGGSILGVKSEGNKKRAQPSPPATALWNLEPKQLQMYAIKLHP